MSNFTYRPAPDPATPTPATPATKVAPPDYLICASCNRLELPDRGKIGGKCAGCAAGVLKASTVTRTALLATIGFDRADRFRAQHLGQGPTQ